MSKQNDQFQEVCVLLSALPQELRLVFETTGYGHGCPTICASDTATAVQLQWSQSSTHDINQRWQPFIVTCC